MNLNKKGFTLVELLAVVVILLAISTVAISSISAAIERNKEKQDNAKIEVILNYGRLYYQSHKNSLGKEFGLEYGFSNRACIELDSLDLSEDERKYTSGEFIEGVVIYNKNDYSFDKSNYNCQYYRNKKNVEW